MANGMRLILLLLIPATAAILVLSEPMIRLVYERGDFGAEATDLVADGALLVRLLAAVQRPLPAPHADLLQPPAALGADRDRGRQPGDHRGRRVRRSTSRSGSAGSSPRPRSRPRPASSPRRWSCARRSAGSSSAGSPGRRSGSSLASAALAAVSYGVWDLLDDALGRGPRRPDRLARGRRLPPAPSSTPARSRCCGSPRPAQIWALLRRAVAATRPSPRPPTSATRTGSRRTRTEDECWRRTTASRSRMSRSTRLGGAPVDGPATVLVIESGDRAGEEFAIERPRTTIGRTPRPTSSSTT